MADYVLDTSALLTLLKDEDGADEVEAILEACEAGRSRAYLPFMSAMELEYLVLRSSGRAAVERVLRILQAWPVERMESDPGWGRKAAAVKAQGGLSMADAWISSLALMLGAELVHKDPELDALLDLKHRRLPYKKL
jgi:predicted nucleic acid-binding protein